MDQNLLTATITTTTTTVGSSSSTSSSSSLECHEQQHSETKQCNDPDQKQNLKDQVTIRLQLFPYQDTSRNKAPYIFQPIEVDLKPGVVVKLGRRIDKRKDNASKPNERSKYSENEDPSVTSSFTMNKHTNHHHHHSNPIDDSTSHPTLDDDNGNRNENNTGTSSNTVLSPISANEIRTEFIAFKSKVVSRSHAELWVGKDGQVYFRDVGSSSGTFINRLRLSPSGKESRQYILKSEDVVQLGVDYQGRVEKIYKAVIMKVFITLISGKKTNVNTKRMKLALHALLAATNLNADTPMDTRSSDCCICLNTISPLQALFLSPCSHCFHYKCVVPLLNSGLMFQCPLCRQVANLEASVACEDSELYSESQELEEKDLWNKLVYLEKLDKEQQKQQQKDHELSQPHIHQELEGEKTLHRPLKRTQRFQDDDGDLVMEDRKSNESNSPLICHENASVLLNNRKRIEESENASSFSLGGLVTVPPFDRSAQTNTFPQQESHQHSSSYHTLQEQHFAYDRRQESDGSRSPPPFTYDNGIDGNLHRARTIQNEHGRQNDGSTPSEEDVEGEEDIQVMSSTNLNAADLINPENHYQYPTNEDLDPLINLLMRKARGNRFSKEDLLAKIQERLRQLD